MERERIRNRYYIEGSTVRKLDEIQPQRIPQKSPQRQVEVSPRRRVNRAPVRKTEFNQNYAFWVVSALVIVFFVGVSMIYMETKISDQKRNLTNLEAEFNAISESNNTYKMSIENMYTLDQIQEVATNELGMTYAKKGQIVYYNSANDDFVKQYQDIPEVE